MVAFLNIGYLYLEAVADGASEFRKCYNTSVEMHCFDLQYDTNDRMLAASFDNAQERCDALKSTLIVMKDKETNNIVYNYFDDPSNPVRLYNVWTDAYRISDYNNTHTWHWLNSTLSNIPGRHTAGMCHSSSTLGS